MPDHVTLADALGAAYRRAVEEGREMAEAVTAAVAGQLLLTFLRIRWDVPRDLARQIGAERSPATLERWHVLALAADNLEAFRQAIAREA